MPVSEEEVREELPNGGSQVSGPLIEGYIKAWTNRLTLVVGPEHVETDMAKDVILLGARGRARQAFDANQGRTESPLGVSMLAQAEAMLKALDEATASPVEAGAVRPLVSQTIASPLWEDVSEDWAF